MAGRRQMKREGNRLTLIEAVLASIAERGIAETSVSEIVHRAQLSRGMIHLHFGGKDQLFEAAARHASDLYYEGIEASLGTAGDSGQQRIESIVRADLSEAVLNRTSVCLWHAFRGDALNHPAFADHADTRDARLRDLIAGAFARIVTETGALDGPVLVRDATLGTLALMEGMWTDYLLHPKRFDRGEARRILFRFLAGLFPAHFTIDGAVMSARDGAGRR